MLVRVFLTASALLLSVIFSCSGSVARAQEIAPFPTKNTKVLPLFNLSKCRMLFRQRGSGDTLRLVQVRKPKRSVTCAIAARRPAKQYLPSEKVYFVTNTPRSQLVPSKVFASRSFEEGSTLSDKIVLQIFSSKLRVLNDPKVLAAFTIEDFNPIPQNTVE